MGDYRSAERLSDGLILLSSSYGLQLWTERKLRKPIECRVCEKVLLVGALAYGEAVSRATNRMHRICSFCVEGLLSPHKSSREIG